MSAPRNADDNDSVMEEESNVPAAAAAGNGGAAAGDKKKKKKKKKSGARGVGADPMEVSKSADELEAEAWLSGLSEEDVLNPQLLDAKFIEELKVTFQANTPYKYLQITDLLDSSFLRTLENELKGLEYFHRSNDLFEFAQSHDLKSVDSPLINKLKTILYGPRFRQILTTITGIDLGELEDTVAVSANVYGDTNTLLCHDDELQGRRIAYILYLVPPTWSAADGGALDLYDTDKDGQPAAIAKSLIPSWNTFTFFEVSPVSFHQVSEVLTSDINEETGENRVRISISGWFHGAPITRPPPFIEPVLQCQPLGDVAVKLDEWLAPDYLKSKNLNKIAAQFANESSIELAGFIKKERYAQLTQALAEVKEWKEVGPANKRKYMSVDLAASASSSSSSGPLAFLSSLHSFLQSRVFGGFLESITGMSYLSSYGCLRNFTSGCYTLAHNESEERFEEGVDINLSCLQTLLPGTKKNPPPNQWSCEEFGGTTHYIEEGAEEELMSLEPGINTLSIVYRSGIPEEDRAEAKANGTGGVMKFVKYVNHRANQPRFDFDYVFRVEADEEEEEESEEEEPQPVKKGRK